MSTIRWRLLRREQVAQGTMPLTEREASRYVRDALVAVGSVTPARAILVPDTKAGAFLDALGEAGRCAV